jgi:predicted RNase H-like HicB family nuclease
MKFPVVLTPGEDGWVIAECPLIPGCISQGKDQREAIANIREAIELCIETQPTEGWTLPPEYQVVDIDIAIAA